MLVPARRLGNTRNSDKVRRMKHWFWLPMVGLLLGAPWGSTSPTQPKNLVKLATPPLSAHLFVVACNGGERTGVIASGDLHAPLGLFIYDPHGNCVAHDEATGPVTADDLYAEWFPPATMPYTIEVRNQGLQGSKINVIFR
jgi:hypothetical protein